ARRRSGGTAASAASPTTRGRIRITASASNAARQLTSSTRSTTNRSRADDRSTTIGRLRTEVGGTDADVPFFAGAHGEPARLQPAGGLAVRVSAAAIEGFLAGACYDGRHTDDCLFRVRNHSGTNADP